MSIEHAVGLEARPTPALQPLGGFETFNRAPADTVIPDSQQPMEIPVEGQKPLAVPGRNLFVQYKAFPSLERLKT